MLPLHAGPPLPVPYFTLLVLFGAFFAMQLLVAIMSSKFAQLTAQQPKKAKKKKRRLQVRWGVGVRR
jgi:hypothetical protein